MNVSDQLLTGDEAFSLKITPLFSLGGEWAREDVEEAGTLLYSKGDEESGEVEVVDGDPSCIPVGERPPGGPLTVIIQAGSSISLSTRLLSSLKQQRKCV